MTSSEVQSFATHWLEAWNTRDLEAILEHFTDDVVFTSPLAQRILEGSNGIVRGKDALRAYWREGLDRSPELHFEIEAIYQGVDTLVINYRNQSRNMINEVLRFRGKLVCEGHGTYELA